MTSPDTGRAGEVRGRGKGRLVARSCSSCGKEYVSASSLQKLCIPCRSERKQTVTQSLIERRRQGRSEGIETIRATEGRQNTTLLDITGMPTMAWQVIYSVPFDRNASKNSRFAWSRPKGGPFVNPGVREYQDMVVAATRAALRGIDVKHNKLWIGLLVEKPTHKFDAVNVVDTMCDAIKVAVGLDDNWFSLRKVDWVIRKTDPNIIVALGQESNEDVCLCSACGEIKAPEEFSISRHSRTGRNQNCRSCTSIIGAASRKKKAAE